MVGMLLLVMALLGGCQLQNQKASENFTAGKLPPKLHRLVNPPAAATALTSDAAVASEPRLRAAVIDSGVDYTMQDIKDRIVVTREKGQVTGVGFDIFGDDNWAHPNLMEASYYAFGAKAIEKGKITGPLADPFAALVRYQEQFDDILTENILSDKVLSQSVFRHWPRNVMSLFYLQKKRHASKDWVPVPRLGRKINLTNPEAEDEIMIKRCFERQLIFSAAKPQLPAICGANVDILSDTDLGERFIEVADESFEAFIRQSDYQAAFATFEAYHRARHATKTIGALADQLHGAWFKISRRGVGEDPLFDALAVICAMADDEEFENISRWDDNPQRRTSLYQDLFRRFLRYQESLDALIASHSNSSKVRKEAARSRAKILSHLEMDFLHSLAAKNLGQHSCKNPESWALNADYRDYFDRKADPLLAQNRAIRHGTHVAGILMSQDPGIDIVPVRVAYGNPSLAAPKSEVLLAEFQHEFLRFLQLPHVAAAILNAPDLAAFKGNGWDQALASLSQDDRNRTAWMLYFLHELEISLDWVHKKEIKVANLSLGLSFTKFEDKVEEGKGQGKLNASYGFLFNEYLKYRLAEAFNRNPHTLFVIAAGNDSKVIDGLKFSTLPCNASSPFLQPYRDLAPGGLPMNELKNVMCVMSMDKDQSPSSFTNLLKVQVPTMITFGNEIYSALPVYDCAGAEEAYEDRFGKYNPVSSIDLSVIGGSLSSWQNTMSLGFLGALVDAYVKDSCIAGAYRGARLSGTSMASPAAAGYISHRILEKMRSEQRSAEDIFYDYPPAQIIDDLSVELPVYQLGDDLPSTRAVTEVRAFPGDAEGVKLEMFMSQADLQF